MKRLIHLSVLICVILMCFCITPVSAESRSDLVFDLGGGVTDQWQESEGYIIKALYYTNPSGKTYSGMNVDVTDWGSNAEYMFDYEISGLKDRFVYSSCSLGDACSVGTGKGDFAKHHSVIFLLGNYLVRVYSQIYDNAMSPTDLMVTAQKIADVLSGSSGEPAKVNPLHSTLISYLKDPMYAAPTGFGKLSDSSIEKALQQDKTGSADILTKSMLPEIAWVEYLSSREVPPQGFGYDENLFSKKKTLLEFMEEQAEDEAVSAMADTLLDLVENEVVEQSTKIIPISSLVNLYSTGMALSEYYRDNMLVTDFQDDLRNSYFGNRDSGKTPQEALAAARNENSGVYSGYLEGLIRKGNSEAALIAALENQYYMYKWREEIKDNKANKYQKIAKITMKNKYYEPMNTILKAAQDIEKNQ